jgi:hypothetical protein
LYGECGPSAAQALRKIQYFKAGTVMTGDRILLVFSLVWVLAALGGVI